MVELHNLELWNDSCRCEKSMLPKYITAGKVGIEWKATHFSHICSNHFTIQDYVIPPSDNETCRLKHNAVPTSFPLVNRPNYGISMNIRHWLESADSVLHDHTYCAKVDGASQQDVEKPDLQDKLKRKIRCLQQQLRRKKAKTTNNGRLNPGLVTKIYIKTWLCRIHACKIWWYTIINFPRHQEKCKLWSLWETISRQLNVKEFATTLNYHPPTAYEYAC